MHLAVMARLWGTRECTWSRCARRNRGACCGMYYGNRANNIQMSTMEHRSPNHNFRTTPERGFPSFPSVLRAIAGCLYDPMSTL